MFFMNTVSHSWLSSSSYTILIFVRLPEEIVSLVYFVFQNLILCYIADPVKLSVLKFLEVI